MLILFQARKKMVVCVELSYSIDKKGRNVANIKVCGNIQKSSDFPVVKFNFLGGKSMRISALGTQNLTYVAPKPAHNNCHLIPNSQLLTPNSQLPTPNS